MGRRAIGDRCVGDYEFVLSMNGPLTANALARRLGVKLKRCQRSLGILIDLDCVLKTEDGRFDIKRPVTTLGGRFP